ncbi:hypothetical protein F7725_012383 [Dissostichus mawsoni]|uniref:Uncharacterized protein n=1 Tax=Dissostichus mawsoni TaxID=36200 RepID=A0A7J5YNT1_DISMA|nr:hypothetical protein F7725_012383 [Dissostichus mawsoni]
MNIWRVSTAATRLSLSSVRTDGYVEWFGIEHRTFSGVIISLDWTIGNFLLVGIAYFIKDWRMLILAVASRVCEVAAGKREGGRCSLLHNTMFGVAFTYYGISLNIIGFGLNPYLTQFIFASIEMPMKIGVYFYLEKLAEDKWIVRTVVAVLARLGVSISPLIMLLEDVWHLLPAVTYCAVAVGSGLVASLLPETLNTRLPESIEDIEKTR